MDTYSAAKMKFIGKLINDGFTDSQLAQIGHAFDFAMADFSIAGKTTSLVAYNDGIRKDLNNYFIDRRIRGLSEQTIRNQEIFFKGFLEYTGNVPTDSISTVMLEKFLLLKTQSGVSAATVNSYRGFLHSFFAWTTKHHITDCNVAEDVLKRKEAKTLVPHLHKDEIELVREYATDQLDRLYIEFLYATGVRVSDLVQLKRCDIAQSDDDPDVYTVHILHGKGDKERYALLNSAVKERLDEYLSRRTDNNPYLFVSERGAHQITTAAIRVRFRRLAEEIYKATGREISMSPHKWRHTYATDLLRNGMDIVSLQQTLGHSSVSTTQIYARQSLTNAVKDYAKAIQ